MSGGGRRRLGDLALLLLAVGVVLLVVLALRPAEPGTAVLRPATGSTPDRTATTAPTASPTPAGGPPATAALGDGLVADDDGWYRLLVSSAGAPVRDVLNAGVPGQTAAQVAARVDAVLAADPQVVLVQAGTNDLLGGVPRETTLTALRGIVTRVQAGGAVPVLVAVPPSDVRADRVGPLNAGIAELGAAASALVIDPWDGVRRPDGGWVPGTSADGVEPTSETSRQVADSAGDLLEAADLPAG